MEQAARELLERVLGRDNAPTLSPLAVKLVELASDDQADMRDLARIIEQDPGLTTRLLRLVNSPAFRASAEEITSVQRAVIFLGLREVRVMALGISLRQSLPLKKNDPLYYRYWRASLHRAVLARLLAARLGVKQADELFVAGLLADLGLPLLLAVLDPGEMEGFPGVEASLPLQLYWEQRRFGLDHRQVGAAAMRRWGLPGLLIRCQEPVLGDGAEGASAEQKVVDFARRGVEALFGVECGIHQLHALAQRWFGLGDEALDKLVGQALGQAAEAAAVMDVELDHQADLLEVMEKANQALGRLSGQMEPHVKRIVSGGGEARRLQEETLVNTLEAVAHEIRNPLMSVGGFARRLAKLLEGGGELQHYAQVILDEAGRLDGVLAEMSSLVAPFKPNIEPISINELVEQVCGRAPGAGLALAMHLPGQSINIAADRRGLEKTLELMLAYGSHLSRRGGDGTVHVHIAANQEEVIITVFGAGEAPAGEGPLADRSFGPELGLAKARRIVEAHGGRLEVEAGPKGAGFVLGAHLPAARPTEADNRLAV